MLKTIALDDILTPSEIERARDIYRERERVNARLVAELVAPNMARINAALGQENDARFIAYAIEYCLLQESLRGRKKRGPRKDSPWKENAHEQ